MVLAPRLGARIEELGLELSFVDRLRVAVSADLEKALENNAAPGVFTPARMALLKVLAAGAATSLGGTNTKV